MYSDYKSPYAFIAFEPTYELEEKTKSDYSYKEKLSDEFES